MKLHPETCLCIADAFAAHVAASEALLAADVPEYHRQCAKRDARLVWVGLEPLEDLLARACTKRGPMTQGDVEQLVPAEPLRLPVS